MPYNPCSPTEQDWTPAPLRTENRKREQSEQKTENASASEPNHASEASYNLLRRLQENPGASQRQLAKELGISLGKTNYCLKALLDKGYIKADNFKNSQNKRAYLCLLTPAGVAAKGGG